MARLSTTLLLSLLFVLFASGSPIPRRSRRSNLPSFPLVRRVSPTTVTRIADVDRARFAGHLTRVGSHDLAAQVHQFNGGFGFFGGGGHNGGHGGGIGAGGGGFGAGGGGGNGNGNGAGGQGVAPTSSSSAVAATGSTSTGTGATGTTNSTGTTGSAAAGINVQVANTLSSYVAQIEVGNPPTTYNLIVDTGSSNTWVGADPQNPFVQTSTTTATNEDVSVTYGSGDFTGQEFTDQVNLGGGLTTKQSIGAAQSSTGFTGVDGILGVGPTDLTTGTLSGAAAKSTIPTISDSLFSSGVIDTEILGVSFAPSTSAQATENGVLTFGGVDNSLFTGALTFQPITKTAPASEFWGVNISLAQDTTPLIGSTAGIMDTGTTLFLLADDVFQTYLNAIPGATLDQQTGMIEIPLASVDKIPTLNIDFAGTTFPLSSDAQVFPKALNTALGGSENVAYGIVNSLGTNSGQGLDFIFGMTALERFYAAFSTSDNTVGLATTPNTDATFFDSTGTSSANKRSILPRLARTFGLAE